MMFLHNERAIENFLHRISLQTAFELLLKFINYLNVASEMPNFSKSMPFLHALSRSENHLNYTRNILYLIKYVSYS